MANKSKYNILDKKITIGSIVYFRSRKWKYTENYKCKCHLVLLKTEKPVRLDEDYVTEAYTNIKNLILLKQGIKK